MSPRQRSPHHLFWSGRDRWVIQQHGSKLGEGPLLAGLQQAVARWIGSVNVQGGFMARGPVRDRVQELLRCSNARAQHNWVVNLERPHETEGREVVNGAECTGFECGISAQQLTRRVRLLALYACSEIGRGDGAGVAPPRPGVKPPNATCPSASRSRRAPTLGGGVGTPHGVFNIYMFRSDHLYNKYHNHQQGGGTDDDREGRNESGDH